MKKFLPVSIAILSLVIPQISQAQISQAQTSHAKSSWFNFKKNNSRSYVYVAGSSTISPLMAAVSEEFSRLQAQKGMIIETPVVESTGTIEGIKVFCQGLDTKYPDFVSASRPFHNEEIRFCNQNGVREIMEIKIGYDGIVLVSASAKKINLTKEQIFKALAKNVFDSESGKLVKNPYQKWSDIDPNLPNENILIFGPPLTSGTRDVFADMLMLEYCLSDENLSKLYANKENQKEKCVAFRNDGKFVQSGENDQLIAQNLKANRNAFGIVGFNFLVANKGQFFPAKIENVEANFKNISSKKYALSRPLFVYFKKENLAVTPKMREFIQELVSEETIGDKGYLVNNGLVPLNKNDIELLKKNILPLTK